MTTKTETILDTLRAFLRRFIVFESEVYELIVALWIIHTHTFMEAFPRTPWVTPYLYVWSDVPGAGKTTTIRVLTPLVYNPEAAGDITSAAMFTMIGGSSEEDGEKEGRITLLIDEIDTVFNGSGEGNRDLRRTINTGYEQSGYAIRKQGRVAVKFSTFCAKLLAGIADLHSDLPDTIKTRSIPIHLIKARPPERFYSFKAGPEAAELSQAISQWVRVNGEAIIDYEPEELESIDPRGFEISFPLLQLAHVLGVEEEVRTALIQLLAPPPPKDKPEIAMLRKILELFESTGRDRLFTEEITTALGEGWNGRLLASRLQAVGVHFPNPTKPGATNMTIKGKRGRGYAKAQFTDAWVRYL